MKQSEIIAQSEGKELAIIADVFQSYSQLLSDRLMKPETEETLSNKVFKIDDDVEI